MREVYRWNLFTDETWEVKSMLFISHRDIMPWSKRHWNIFSPGGYILLDILLRQRCAQSELDSVSG